MFGVPFGLRGGRSPAQAAAGHAFFVRPAVGTGVSAGVLNCPCHIHFVTKNHPQISHFTRFCVTSLSFATFRRVTTRLPKTDQATVWASFPSTLCGATWGGKRWTHRHRGGVLFRPFGHFG